MRGRGCNGTNTGGRKKKKRQGADLQYFFVRKATTVRWLARKEGKQEVEKTIPVFDVWEGCNRCLPSQVLAKRP